MEDSPVIPSSGFYMSQASQCSYLKGQIERRIVCSLEEKHPIDLYTILTLAGFRRSHNSLYKPACPSCQECKAVRVVARKFRRTKSQKRTYLKNNDLISDIKKARASVEQFKLFSSYQAERHRGGEMSKMGFSEYKEMIEDTHIETYLAEFRLSNGKLIAVLLLLEAKKYPAVTLIWFCH